MCIRASARPRIVSDSMGAIPPAGYLPILPFEDEAYQFNELMDSKDPKELSTTNMVPLILKTQ